MITLFGYALRAWPLSTPDRFAMMEFQDIAQEIRGKDWLPYYLDMIWTMREPSKPIVRGTWPLAKDTSGKIDVERLPQKLRVASHR